MEDVTDLQRLLHESEALQGAGRLQEAEGMLRQCLEIVETKLAVDKYVDRFHAAQAG